MADSPWGGGLPPVPYVFRKVFSCATFASQVFSFKVDSIRTIFNNSTYLAFWGGYIGAIRPNYTFLERSFTGNISGVRRTNRQTNGWTDGRTSCDSIVCAIHSHAHSHNQLDQLLIRLWPFRVFQIFKLNNFGIIESTTISYSERWSYFAPFLT